MKNNFLMWLILSFVANLIMAALCSEFVGLVIEYSKVLLATVIVALVMTFHEMNEDYEKNDKNK